MSSPSEIDSLLDAQADTGACAPARAPSRMLTLPAEELAINIGIASGLTPREPFSFWMSQLLTRVFRPPIPVAMATASRSRSTGLSSLRPNPASFQASIAAITANWADRSIRLASTRSSTSPGSTATGAAILTGRSAAQSSVRARTPERPASRASQVLGASPPSGVVAPIPVTTTRVLDIKRLLPEPTCLQALHQMWCSSSDKSERAGQDEARSM